MSAEAALEERNEVEIRLRGGLLPLNRLLMTLQNKRMPLVEVRVAGDLEETRASLTLECPEATARRYAGVLEALEDVRELRFGDDPVA